MYVDVQRDAVVLVDVGGAGVFEGVVLVVLIVEEIEGLVLDIEDVLHEDVLEGVLEDGVDEVFEVLRLELELLDIGLAELEKFRYG